MYLNINVFGTVVNITDNDYKYIIHMYINNTKQ